MRMVAAIRSGALVLNSVISIVLDEADKLFDAGRDGQAPDDTFIAQVRAVYCNTYTNLQPKPCRPKLPHV
jgi:superfamily II DNA/RNA helicase